MIRSIQFEKIGTAPTVTGFSLIASGVAGDQSLLFLFVEDSGRQAPALKRCRLLRERAGSIQSIDFPPLDVAFPKVDLFPDGRVLLAGARCGLWAEADDNLDGVIFDPSTGQAKNVHMGRISNLQIDDRGRIWVGYFDEGVLVEPAGLVCLSAFGEKIWEFPADANHMIDDCYALNVTGSEAFIFFYSDFPVYRIGADFQLSWWRTELKGCHAFAMSGTDILFSSQYREAPETAHLGRLAVGEIVDVKQVRLLMPDGSARPPGRLQGRGRHLYHFGEDGIYRATLA